ncbi:hypothetical protein EKO04_003325 [Ascochyta lentis]|uniref:Uncharacterized protein n=1 Tax=Ascochyta lentis TaxID=205686 RepID=A0A8H7MG01_9PLEO|nr:hypothetical protein EKO04_003325 [Ascochyta lentis]
MSTMRRRGLSLMAFVGFAAAQGNIDLNVNNTVVSLSSCESLACNFPDNSICNASSEDGKPVGVGIAAGAVNTSSASLSFSLIVGLDSPGFTGIGSSQYEHTDAQLFAGLDSSLDEDDFPSGCVFMMQYQAQTFPQENWLDNNVRPQADTNTTSCTGVIDPFCQASLTESIYSFHENSSNSNSSQDRCSRLTSHMNAQLQKNDATCGREGTWIANFMNITGGSLPSPGSSTNDLDPRLGSDGCYAVEPATYQLYKVAEMRQLYFMNPPSSDSDYYGKVFAGLAGYTPIITVLYRDDQDYEIMDGGVQFSCLQTFQPDGKEMKYPSEGAGVALSRGVGFASVLAVLVSVGLVL